MLNFDDDVDANANVKCGTYLYPFHLRLNRTIGGRAESPPPTVPCQNSFIFMQFLAKILPSNRFLPQTHTLVRPSHGNISDFVNSGDIYITITAINMLALWIFSKKNEKFCRIVKKKILKSR